MDALLEETLKHDLMPLVVTEFPGITVGGAFSGTAGESSSFKHGFFDRTVDEVEMILANGKVVKCSEIENADIFKGITGALGTLGVVTLLHIRLQKAAKYVEATYHPVQSAREAIEKLRTFAAQDDIDYLEGIMFSPTKGMIITGRHTGSSPDELKVQRFIRGQDPWFFMHGESCISSGPFKPYKDLIPLPDYVFRYNRGTFWCSKQIFDLFGIKFSKTTWRIFDRLLTARMSYKRLHMQEVSTTLIQDVAVPFSAAEELIKWSEDRLEIWPLWLCPLRVSLMPTLHPHPLKPTVEWNTDQNTMLNIGIYDASGRSYEDWIIENRELEDKVQQLGGMKWAYAAQFYPEHRFWEQHDREWYDGLRERCHSTTLPNIFEKTRVDINGGRKIVVDMLAKRNKIWRRPFGGLPNVGSYVHCVWNSVRSEAWKMERRNAWRKWPAR